MKSKRIQYLLGISLICITLVCLTACETIFVMPKFDIDMSVDFTKFNVADKYSAYDIFTDAYDNYVNDNKYTYEQYFNFNAKALGIVVATQQRKIIKKADNGKIYENKIVVGTGEGKEHLASKFYYDGKKAYEIAINDKSTVPGTGTGEEIFNVRDYGEFSSYTGNAQQKINELKKRICFYDFSKREYLSKNHSDTVYEKDNVYYFTISFDSTSEAMNTFNAASKEEFIRALGIADSDRNSLKLLDDSQYRVAVADIKGQMKFIAMQLIETYEGKARGFMAAARNVDTYMFDYNADKYSINNVDIAELF